MAKIIIIDDEESICRMLSKTFREMGHVVSIAPTAEKGLNRIAEDGADIAVLDVRLPGMDGLEALEQIRETSPDTETIIITAHGTMDTAIRAVQRGAFDYFTKPLDMPSLQTAVARALESIRNRDETAELTDAEDVLAGGPMVGRTPVMAEVFKKIGAVAGSDANVLVIGESGTGKELVARAIHDTGLRREGPFEPVNCAALPENLLESELFGFEKGAFTGASFQRIGKFERASAGTLFLDEVGAMPVGSQAKLLRVLQEREIERLGGHERIPVDIRVISASNEPLENRVKDGTFREDLYYRLKVVSIPLPPLRDRVEDIPLLAAAFMSEFGAEDTEISKSALDILRAHTWPGNVRELKNAVEHAVVLARGGTIMPSHLPAGVTGGATGDEHASEVERLVAQYVAELDEPGDAYAEVMGVWEKALIERALLLSGDNQVKTAAFLGINRSTLRKKMGIYGLGGT